MFTLPHLAMQKDGLAKSFPDDLPTTDVGFNAKLRAFCL